MVMTLSELRSYHQRWHAGYIWDCPHCAEQWRKLKQEEMQNENLSNLQQAEQ